MDERPPLILPCAGQCPDRHIHFQGTTRQGRGCVEGAQRWHRLLLILVERPGRRPSLMTAAGFGFPPIPEAGGAYWGAFRIIRSNLNCDTPNTLLRSSGFQPQGQKA